MPITECGGKYTEQSTKYYIQYRDSTGKKRRVPGYTDKEATAQLAADLERKARLIQSGLTDPHESGKTRPLHEHLADFHDYLEARDNSQKHVTQTWTRIDRLVRGCGFSNWCDITPSAIVNWLAAERGANRIGLKTSNYYLAAIKQFCTWLEDDGRVPKARNPIEHLTALSAETDIRWQRRAISTEEFSRLIAAAHTGPKVQCVAGPERAMLYVLAAWTGYRREEIASLTIKSFDLDALPATVKVSASFSKRRKNDIIPLHPAVTEQLRSWIGKLANATPDTHLFHLKTLGGGLRRTAKMMRLDLERARQIWINESSSAEEKRRRQDSDYLQYQSGDGLYADFHANRHTFITNLALAGVHPKLAQSIARHSDVNLTLGIYSHVDIGKQAEAISLLPAPPEMLAPATESQSQAGEADPKAKPRPQSHTVESVAPIVAPAFGFECLCMASAVTEATTEFSGERKQKPLPEQGLVAICHHLAQGDLSSGGGIRTPDTRIMIPLL